MIPKSDLKVERFRSSGNGGQNVNKRETAIRLTHIPSGIMSTSQDERSQSQNYQKALDTLEERVLHWLNEQRKDAENELRGALNKGRVRTYDFTKNTAYDHVSGKQAPLKKVLDGDLNCLR